MPFEYGCVVGMNEHEIIGTEPTMLGAMRQCEMLQLDWNGTSVMGWPFIGGEFRGVSDNPNEPWYVRKVES